MSPEDAEGLPCLSFDSAEFTWAFSELVFSIHERLASGFVCFNPFSSGGDGYAEDKIGRICSVVDSVFGTMYGQTPDERYGGDFFLQVATFCDHLANDHIFPDGNKRTALVATYGVLYLNGVGLELIDSDDPELNEAYLLIKDVVAGGKSTEELASLFMRYATLSTEG